MVSHKELAHTELERARVKHTASVMNTSAVSRQAMHTSAPPGDETSVDNYIGRANERRCGESRPTSVHGLYSYGLHSYGLYRYGLHSYGPAGLVRAMGDRTHRVSHEMHRLASSIGCLFVKRETSLFRGSSPRETSSARHCPSGSL